MIRNVMNSMAVCAIVLSAAMIGCAMPDNDTEDVQGIKALDTSIFVLTVGGDGEAGTQITASGISDHCDANTICQFPFFAGAALTLRPDFTKTFIDCLQFVGWEGACTGQHSTTCNIVINSDLSASQKPWGRISGCIPQ